MLLLLEGSEVATRHESTVSFKTQRGGTSELYGGTSFLNSIFPSSLFLCAIHPDDVKVASQTPEGAFIFSEQVRDLKD
jgi:hypothetical protein